jgi:hypothetical protein
VKEAPKSTFENDYFEKRNLISIGDFVVMQELKDVFVGQVISFQFDAKYKKDKKYRRDYYEFPLEKINTQKSTKQKSTKQKPIEESEKKSTKIDNVLLLANWYLLTFENEDLLLMPNNDLFPVKSYKGTLRENLVYFKESKINKDAAVHLKSILQP